jgi:glutamate racemase
VTDSGLGGLSVAADLARRAQESKAYAEVDIVFVNALFRPEAGYNSLASREEKVAVFDSALAAMAETYEPDAILVACNTLSVLLPDCETAEGPVPVTGIVEAGVELIEDQLEARPDATALLFATQTTVEEDSHRQGLLARGVSEDRFALQACPELTWYIERDPLGFDTELLISTFVSDALAQRSDPSAPVAISFNCTHFGYSQELWEQEVRNQGAELVSTLNPNDMMADPLFPEELDGRFEETDVTVSVISMVEIDPVAINALSPVLAETSPAAGRALSEWQLVPELFDWEGALQDIMLKEAPAE